MKKSYLYFLLFLVLVTTVLNIISFLNYQKFIASIKQRNDLRHQKEELLALLSDLQDAETGQRGYLITGRQDYLEPYYQAMQTIDRHLDYIQREVAAVPSQSLFAQELAAFVQLKLKELDEVIHIRQTEGLEAAQKRLRNDEGKQFMDHIRNMIDRFVSNNVQALNQQKPVIQDLVQQIFWISLLSATIPTLLICYLAYLLYRESIKMRKKRDQLKRSDEVHQALFEDSKQIIVTMDPAGMITNMNNGAERILGYKAKDVIQKISILNLYDHNNLKDKAELMIQNDKHQHALDVLIDSNHFLFGTNSDWVMKKKNGNLFPCYQSITALRDESSNIQGYLLIATDLSDYKKWEQQFQGAQAAIEATQLSENKFLNSLNHELRSDLNAIMNFSTLLMKNLGGNLTDLEIAYAEQITNRTQTMLNLINEMLDLPKRQTRPSTTSLRPINLSDMLQQVVKEMKELSKVKFLLDIPQEIKHLETDPDSFNQLLKHLIKHASKYFTGQFIIHVKTDSQTHEPLKIELVQNELMPYTNETPLFDKILLQEEKDLAIAQALAGNLGYQINITSRLGKGIVYNLLLNRPTSISESLTSEQIQAVPTAVNLSASESPFSWRVLIVDNDPEFLAILTSYLNDLGCQVISVSSGEEAIKMAKLNVFDLITMDMLMAPLNGYDVVQILKSDPGLQKIPIAFISVIAKEIKGKVPGVMAYIDKPITKENIIQLLQKCQAMRKTS